MKFSATALAVSFFAVFLAALGLIFLFAPQEAAAYLGSADPPEPLVSVLGGALLGFAAMCWVARGALLGGIYGRPVVAANQLHFVVGAIVSGKHLLGAGGPVGLWIVAGVYALGAIFFVRLSFTSPVKPLAEGSRSGDR